VETDTHTHTDTHTDTQTHTQTHKPSTVTLAAHARRGLTKTGWSCRVKHQYLSFFFSL